MTKKTRDAFAFRGFDSQRILQRPYFREFGFDANKTDEEILQDLSLAADDSLATIERKHNAVNELFQELQRLDVLVCHHTKRIKRCQQNLSKKINSVYDDDVKKELEKRREYGRRLGFEYVFSISSNLEDLMNPLEKIWHELEMRLQTLYRKFFAERLRKARIKANLSRQQLGDTIFISPNGFGLYETGKREPSITSLIRLSRVLNVSVDWLIGATP